MAQDKPQSTYEEIVAGLGGDPGIAEIGIYHNQLLLGIYMRPGVTAGGIILTEKTVTEDQWQGKVGVVLAKGPTAFVNDDRTDFHGQNVSVGQWVVYRISDGFPLDIMGVHCRLIDDIDVKALIIDPTIIY